MTAREELLTRVRRQARQFAIQNACQQRELVQTPGTGVDWEMVEMMLTGYIDGFVCILAASGRRRQLYDLLQRAADELAADIGPAAGVYDFKRKGKG